MEPKQPPSNPSNPVMPSYTIPGNLDPEVPEPDNKQAADLIRNKIEALYQKEPSAKEETLETEDMPKADRSKHQDFMYRLSTSGKSLADIQTQWHKYYADLSENEKHEVWQEFYIEHAKKSHTSLVQQAEETPKTPQHYVHSQHPHRSKGAQTVSQIKTRINKTVNKNGRLKPKHHFQSLMFGLGMGSLAILILLFGFFNERIIAPFITPSRKVTTTPIIIDASTMAVDPQPKVIIPKINVEVPVDYNETSIDENAVQKSLENGILHYPTTVNPGELGNSAFFGHSSSNIFNKGKYKFAFILLRKLEVGDIFYLTKDSKRYTYRIYDKRVVKPTEVSVLENRDKPATATLITCDPPGASFNRMVITGEQINPDPASNGPSHVDSSQQQQPKELPSNAPSLWQRIKLWLRN